MRESRMRVPQRTGSRVATRVDTTDFDGDAMAGMLLLDDLLSDDLDAHLPHMNAFEANQLETVSANLAIPKPVVANMAEYVHEEDNRIDQSRMTEYLI